MQDFGESKIFKSIAFEPSPEELSKFARVRRENRRAALRKKSNFKSEYISSSEDENEDDVKAEKTFDEKALDSSDDEFPDVADMWGDEKDKAKKRAKTEGKSKKEEVSLPVL